MTRNRFWFTKELEREAYAALIALGARFATRALLVVRPSLGLADRAKDLIERLQPWLVSDETAAEWPGTSLYEGQTARVRSYSLTGESVTILASEGARLYAWIQPALPEDLCLLREDGEPWLVTIAHENQAYLWLGKEEYDWLLDEQPVVAGHLQVP